MFRLARGGASAALQRILVRFGARGFGLSSPSGGKAGRVYPVRGREHPSSSGQRHRFGGGTDGCSRGDPPATLVSAGGAAVTGLGRGVWWVARSVLFGARGTRGESSGNRRRATAAVMRYGCRRGKSSEGVNRVAGNDSTDLCPLPLGADGTGPRTSGNAANPRSVAGCNKPAPSRAEQTVMVVRNHEGGTRPAAGTVGPKGASAPGSGRERGISAEGRYPNESQESRRRREPTPALLRAL